MGKKNFSLKRRPLCHTPIPKALGHVLIIRDVLDDGFGVWLSNCHEI